jgi:hypothetical protein
MSEHEALARFHYGCAARYHKVEIRRLWRSRCMMQAQRSPLTNILIRIRLLRLGRAFGFVGLPFTSACGIGRRATFLTASTKRSHASGCSSISFGVRRGAFIPSFGRYSTAGRP